jgi:glutaredoxin
MEWSPLNRRTFMARQSRRYNAVLALAALATASGVLAQASVYRYTDTDGRVVYSDRPPPTSAKNVQAKRLGVNLVETSEPSLAAQQASERYPVTLFTFDCGEVCTNAEGLLNKRGVPFSVVNVQTDEPGRTRMQALTGDDKAPVLAVGDQLIVKGYNESRWQATLDQAGYPKAPATRTAATAGRTAPASPAPVVAEPPRAVSPPAKGTDYPK